MRMNQLQADSDRVTTQLLTDAQIGRLPDEATAIMAFEVNEPLQRRHKDVGSFCNYWRSLRNRLGLPAPMIEAQKLSTNDEHQFKADWDASPGTRAEFNEDFSSYAAYRRAEARGRVRICRGSVVTAAGPSQQ